MTGSEKFVSVETKKEELVDGHEKKILDEKQDGEDVFNKDANDLIKKSESQKTLEELSKKFGGSNFDLSQILSQINNLSRKQELPNSKKIDLNKLLNQDEKGSLKEGFKVDNIVKKCFDDSVSISDINFAIKYLLTSLKNFEEKNPGYTNRKIISDLSKLSASKFEKIQNKKSLEECDAKLNTL